MKLKLGSTINFLVLSENQCEIGVFGELEESLKIRVNSFEAV